jgi:hypothetical protein
MNGEHMKLLTIAILATACGHSAEIQTDAGADAPAAPPDASTAGVRTIPLEGCGYSYTGEFDLGGAAYRLTVDTGSPWLAVAAQGCTQCATDGVTDLYSPGPSAVDQHIAQSGVYDGGNISWEGEVYLEQVSAGLLPDVPLEVDAISSEMNFFSADQCGSPQGILGLSPDFDSAAVPTSFPNALAREGAKDELALHYCGGSGTMWIDGYDPTAAIEAPTWIAMNEQEFYAIPVADFAVAGISIGLPAATYGDGIVDSGGPNLILPTAAYDAISTALAGSPAFTAKFGTSWFTMPQCIELPDTRAQIDAAMPVLSVRVGSPAVAIDLPATSGYLQVYATQTGTVYCPALFDGGLLGIGTDLGNTLIRAGIVIFDRENARLGFAHTQACDSPAHPVDKVPPIRPFARARFQTH